MCATLCWIWLRRVRLPVRPLGTFDLSIFGDDPQPVVYILYARHSLGKILGAAFLLTRVDGSRQGNLAIIDRHFNVGRVDSVVLSEAIASIFANALIRASITLRPTASERTFGTADRLPVIERLPVGRLPAGVCVVAVVAVARKLACIAAQVASPCTRRAARGTLVACILAIVEPSPGTCCDIIAARPIALRIVTVVVAARSPAASLEAFALELIVLAAVARLRAWSAPTWSASTVASKVRSLLSALVSVVISACAAAIAMPII